MKMLVKLPYFTARDISDSETSLTWRNYGFRPNSCFDPDESGYGHQARGFDQWSTLYQNYLVRGFSYEVEIRASSNTALTSLSPDIMTFVYFGMAGSFQRDFLPSYSLTDLREQPKNKYFRWKRDARQTQYVGMPMTPATATSQGSFKGYISCKRMHRDFQGVENFSGPTPAGTTNLVWPASYQAATSADPIGLIEMWIGAAALPFGGSSVSTYLPVCQFTCRLVQYVEFFNPANPAYSVLEGITGATGTGSIGGTGTMLDTNSFNVYA